MHNEPCDEQKRGRGRPKKKPRNRPDTRPFDDIAAGLQAIPKEGGAWYRAKEAAQAIVDTDKDILLQPSCMRLLQAILANFNHDDGFDFGSRDHYATLCGMHEVTYTKAMRYLRQHGYVLRKRVKRKGAYDLWQTTLPVVLAGHAVAERKRVAGKSNSGSRIIDPGSRIIEFPGQSGQPNGCVIPLAAAAAARERERANPSLKMEETALLREGVLSFLSEEHFARFLQVDAQWGGAARPAEQVAWHLHDLVVEALKTASVDDVRNALVLALASAEEEAARPSRGIRGRFSNFFAKAFPGQLHNLTKDRLKREEELRHVPELEAAKQAAALKVLNIRTTVEEEIAQRRLAAFDQTAAANRATADKAKSEPRPRGASADWYVTGADGRQVFADNAKLLNIAFNAITGVQANMILRAVPEATVQDVHDILLVVSEEFPEQERSPSDKKKDVPPGAIIRKAIDMLEVKLAYAKHGTPDQLCGGNPAMQSKWAAISEDMVAALKQTCPLVDRDDRDQVWWEHVVAFATANRARYGQGLQQEVEAKFKELMAHRQQKAVVRAQEAEKQAEAAEQRRRENEAERRAQAESEAHTLYGGDAWHAFPANKQELILTKAVTSLRGRGQLGDAQRRKDDEGFRLAEQQAFQMYCHLGDRDLAGWLELDREERHRRISHLLVAEQQKARKNEPADHADWRTRQRNAEEAAFMRKAALKRCR